MRNPFETGAVNLNINRVSVGCVGYIEADLEGRAQSTFQLHSQRGSQGRVWHFRPMVQLIFVVSHSLINNITLVAKIVPTRMCGVSHPINYLTTPLGTIIAINKKLWKGGCVMGIMYISRVGQI